MTTPNTPHRFIAGAIDLGEVKAKAEARAQAAQGSAGNPGGTRTGVAVALTLTMENVEQYSQLSDKMAVCLHILL